MIRLFERGLQFLLYSNIYIGLCALVHSAQSLYLFGEDIEGYPYLLGMTFCCTVLIYALHRLISLGKIDPSIESYRFEQIKKQQKIIIGCALLASLGAAVLFFFLGLKTQLALVLPGLLSFGYVIPAIGKKKKRLRDFNFLKIFLIALVWAWVTVLLPLLESNQNLELQHLFYFVERALFIFIITLPFDIRDWEIDKKAGVLTIPAIIGVQNTKYLAYALSLIWLLLCYAMYHEQAFLALALSGISTTFLVAYSNKQQHDYFYTALMDGTMLAQAALIFLLA